MARKKPKAADRRVIIDKAFTYPLDAGNSRTLPAGWRGRVAAELAERIELEGHGRLLDDRASAKAGNGEDGAPGSENGDAGAGCDDAPTEGAIDV